MSLALFCVRKDTGVFCSGAQWCPPLCDPMNCTMPGFPILHYLLEFAQTHIHWVNDAIQPSHRLPPPFLLAFSLSQHQGLFQWVDSSHQMTKLLELQFQHQSVLPMNIQDWIPLELTGLISLLSKEPLRSSPTPQFESINSSGSAFFLIFPQVRPQHQRIPSIGLFGNLYF